MRPTCSGCQHWNAADPKERDPALWHLTRDCRAHAPIARPAPEWRGGTIPSWPRTQGSDWCGEHKPLPQPPADPNH